MTKRAAPPPPDPALFRERLANLPAALAVAARTAPPDPPAAGEWSPREVVRHLIAVELDVWHVRLGQLATETHPRWAWVEPGPWEGSPGADLESLLSTHAIERARTLEILDALGPEGWARRGTHDTYGELDVAGLMRVAADHDDEHLGGLRR